MKVSMCKFMNLYRYTKNLFPTFGIIKMFLEDKAIYLVKIFIVKDICLN